VTRRTRHGTITSMEAEPWKPDELAHAGSDGLTVRVRDLWKSLAGAAAGFSSTMSAAVSPGSRLCPPGWAGIVVLDDAVLATAPDHGTARVLGEALGGVPATSLGDDRVLRSRLPGAEFLVRLPWPT
jgi:hypothetical protein